MKKLILAVVLGFTMVACSSDESTTQQDIQKTNVAFMIDQPSSSSTNRQIKRGNIPVWVNTINIKAESSNYRPYFTSENYTFDEQKGLDYIGLDNVAVGNNKFIGTTTTDSPQFYELTNFTSNATSNNTRFAAALDNIDNENPYVLYAGEKTQSISTSRTNIVTIPMLTNNGRILSVFQVTEDMRDLGIQAKITATVVGESTQTAITKGNELVTFKWSNINSVKDKLVTYKVEIAEINKQNVILKTYTVTEKVQASTSLTCLYTVNTDGITLKRNGVIITLSFQEWKNATCSTCPTVSDVNDGSFWSWFTTHFGK